MENLCDQLYGLLGSKDPLEVLSVLLVIETLLALPGSADLHEQTHRNCCTRFFSFLRIILQMRSHFNIESCVERDGVSSDDLWNLIIVSRTAKTLARVARQGTRPHLSRLGSSVLFSYCLEVPVMFWYGFIRSQITDELDGVN